MYQQKNFCVLVFSCTVGCAPLSFGVPDRQTIRKTRCHLVTQKSLPFQLADRTLWSRGSKIQSSAKLGCITRPTLIKFVLFRRTCRRKGPPHHNSRPENQTYNCRGY